MDFIEKNINFHKNETETKIENPIIHHFREMNFDCSSYRNHKLKGKL